jgi:hypothetical protein
MFAEFSEPLDPDLEGTWNCFQVPFQGIWVGQLYHPTKCSQLGGPELGSTSKFQDLEGTWKELGSNLEGWSIMADGLQSEIITWPHHLPWALAQV